MKTREEKLIQVKRIMKKLAKRGQNCEAINEIYRELLKPTESCHMAIWDITTGGIYPIDPLKHPGNVLKNPNFKPNNI